MKKIGYTCMAMLLLVGVHLNNQRLAESRQQTLRVWVEQEEYDLLSTINSIFEQQHDVVIEMEVVTSEQVISRLPLYNGSVAYPDIINVSHTLITELVRNGLITPMTDVFEDFNILPTVRTAFKVMDDYYGIPYNAHTNILFYNSTEFPDGVAPHAITEEPEQFSLAMDYQSIYHSLPFVTGFGGYMVGLDNFGDINFYDIGLNRLDSIVGLEHMVQLLNESIIGGTDLDIYETFIEGRANILIAPTHILESLQTEMPNVGFQSIPDFTLNHIPNTYMRIDTYQLTKHVTNKDLAVQYMEFLLSDNVATERYLLNQAVAPIDYETITSSDPYHLVIRRQLHRSLPLPNQVEFNYLYTPYRKAARRFADHSDGIHLILDEAVREIDHQLNNLLE